MLDQSGGGGVPEHELEALRVAVAESTAEQALREQAAWREQRELQAALAASTAGGGFAPPPPAPMEDTPALRAVGGTVILLHPPLPSAGASTWMERRGVSVK